MLCSIALERSSLIDCRLLRATRALINEAEVASGEKFVFMNFGLGSTAIRKIKFDNKSRGHDLMALLELRITINSIDQVVE